MKICRFKYREGEVRVGVVNDDATLLDLTPAGVTRLEPLLEGGDIVARLRQIAQPTLPRVPLDRVRLCAPVERQEVWAAGVTYLRSKTERMAESNFSATAYDRVYEAERPEIFFKALAEKVAATGQEAGIRRDAKWNVPEPELALVFNSAGTLVGHTIGNDMSSRDIEGENLLYLPQAKTYRRSCALGPWITLGADEAEARQWTIRLEIRRGGKTVFEDKTSVSQIKRGFAELADYLFRSQEFPHGVVLLTGTGIVPAAPFTLEARDWVGIEITGIGLLENTVAVV
jgi:2-dehydro-3-deoxy-D-arabinonate dehydratase